MLDFTGITQTINTIGRSLQAELYHQNQYQQRQILTGQHLGYLKREKEDLITHMVMVMLACIAL